VTPDGLIAAGEALRKPCLALAEAGDGPPVAVWGGERADIPNTLPPEITAYKARRHIITVGEALLERLGEHDTGAMSLFEITDEHDETRPIVERSRHEPLASLSLSGSPLYAASERTSFPPFAALCLYGPPSIGEFLASLGLERHQYWKVPRELTKPYDRHHTRDVLKLEEGADVLVGGWHRLWPEDRYYTPLELTYVLLTLRDAEPWYTMWYSPSMRGAFARDHVS
jgi:hypothetical protein